MEQKIIDWLEDSDPVIRFRLHRDILHSDQETLNKIRASISTEGWGKTFLDQRGENKHWGGAYYQPKWMSTHYTLLTLRMMHYPLGDPRISESIELIFDENYGIDGGIVHKVGYPTSDVCINGMFLNIAAYFKAPEKKLESMIDYLLSTQLKDGGFNCQYLRKKTHHSSVHTTLSVCEGYWEYEKNGYTYRCDEVIKQRKEAEEFLLIHKLYKSDKDDSIINQNFLSMHWPYHWHYDVMRALEYFSKSKHPYDPRMKEALDWLRSKAKDGLWPLSPHYSGKTFFTMERVSQKSKINTLRAMNILAHYYRIDKA